MDDLLNRLMILIPVILSLAVHEWAHAQTAFWYGDETADKEGRRTLNPIAHIDPVGTLLLPLLGVPFGWARPVPVNTNGFLVRFNKIRAMQWVAAAGPISNIILAAIALGLMSVLARLSLAAGIYNFVATPLFMFAFINVNLAIFNLLPIPPLDGSKIFGGLLPISLVDRMRAIPGINFLPLVLLLLLLQTEGRAIIDVPIRYVMSLLVNALHVPISY